MLIKIFEIINIFSASLPYYAQINKFKATKNSEGYSTLVSYLCIISCIIKIFFWFGKFYHWSLLMQAILLLIIHTWLIIEAIKWKNINEFKLKEPNTIKEYGKVISEVSLNCKDELFLNSIFSWKQIQLHLLFIFVFFFFTWGICEVCGFSNEFFIETLGISNTFIEGSLAVPQVLEIYKTKNVQNISVVLVLSWFIGDFIKTYYFIVSGSPFQFLLLGIIQITMNCVVVYFYILFYNNK